MIERLLAAERALDAGQLEVAERLYSQVEAADPRNAIAMTGRAKVAHARGDLDGARRHVTRALETDPDDQAARMLVTELGERAAARPAAAPAMEPPVPAAEPGPSAPPVPSPAAPMPASDVTAVRRRSILGSIGALLRRLVGR